MSTIPICPKCGSKKTHWHEERRNIIGCKGCNRNSKIYDKSTQADLVDEIKQLKVDNKDLQFAFDKNEDILNLIEAGKTRGLRVPKWVTPKNAKKNSSIASVMLSDLHLDEVVNPAEINYVNGYNRKIATARLKRFFRSTVKLARDHMGGIKIDGLILNLGGDMVSGNIHEELKISNETGIMDTIVYWTGQLAAGIEQLVDHFETIHIPCVTGNHGRNSIKPIIKGRVRDNFDWLIYKLLELHFKGISEITFDISDGTDVRYTVYNTRYQVTHGDQFRGGSGISGIFTPLKLGNYRKQQRELATGTPYDILVMGHFHQLIDAGGIIVNGSLKGYDEFAAKFNFGFEKPQQYFWLTDPVHGKTITAPIHCYKPGEGWERD